MIGQAIKKKDRGWLNWKKKEPGKGTGELLSCVIAWVLGEAIVEGNKKERKMGTNESG